MRRLVAATLGTALQVGAFQAPLVHAHLDDHHDDHHQATTVHAHFDGHSQHHERARPAAGSSIVITDHESEETTRLQIFVAVEAAAFTTPALPPARFILAAAPESAMCTQLDEVRSHGPPLSRATSPRAPPVSSV